MIVEKYILTIIICIWDYKYSMIDRILKTNIGTLTRNFSYYNVFYLLIFKKTKHVHMYY